MTHICSIIDVSESFLLSDDRLYLASVRVCFRWRAAMNSKKVDKKYDHKKLEFPITTDGIPL